MKENDMPATEEGELGFVYFTDGSCMPLLRGDPMNPEGIEETVRTEIGSGREIAWTLLNLSENAVVNLISAAMFEKLTKSGALALAEKSDTSA